MAVLENSLAATLQTFSLSIFIFIQCAEFFEPPLGKSVGF